MLCLNLLRQRVNNPSRFSRIRSPIFHPDAPVSIPNYSPDPLIIRPPRNFTEEQWNLVKQHIRDEVKICLDLSVRDASQGRLRDIINKEPDIINKQPLSQSSVGGKTDFDYLELKITNLNKRVDDGFDDVKKHQAESEKRSALVFEAKLAGQLDKTHSLIDKTKFRFLMIMISTGSLIIGGVLRNTLFKSLS